MASWLKPFWFLCLFYSNQRPGLNGGKQPRSNKRRSQEEMSSVNSGKLLEKGGGGKG